MVDYPRLQATAQRLIEANGRLITIQRLTRSSDNPSAPWRGSATPGSPPEISVDVVAVFLDSISSRYLGITEQRDGEDKGEQVYVMVASLSHAPHKAEEFDRLIDGNLIYEMKSLNTLKPAGLPMFTAFVLANRELIH